MEQRNGVLVLENVHDCIPSWDCGVSGPFATAVRAPVHIASSRSEEDGRMSNLRLSFNTGATLTRWLPYQQRMKLMSC